MKHITLLFLSVAITGCGADKTDTGSSSDSGEDTGSEIVNPDSGEDTGVEEEGASISGSLFFEDGSPATGVQMRLCYGQCFPAMVDESGNFNYSGKGEGHYSLQAVKLGEDTYAIPSTVVTIGTEDIAMDPWVIPAFSTNTDLTGTQDVELANNLIVSADSASMTLGDYTESEEKYIKSAFVPGDTAGIYLEEVSGEVLGVWYLANFDYRMDPGWAISGSPDLGLNEGETIQAYVADFAAKAWTLVGTYEVDASGALVGNPDNTGLIALSALVLTR